MSHSSFTSPPVVEPRGFFHKSSGLHLGSRQSLDMIWMNWDSHALMAPFFGTDETTHMKFVQNLLFSCFRFQSPLPSTISRAAHAARCGSNNQLTDMSSLENNDLVIVERNIPCLGDGKSGFWNPFCCIGKWYPNGCVAKICWDFIARKTPSHWGVTTLPGSPFQSMLAPDPQIKRVKSFNTHKTSKNASKWTKWTRKKNRWKMVSTPQPRRWLLVCTASNQNSTPRVSFKHLRPATGKSGETHLSHGQRMTNKTGGVKSENHPHPHGVFLPTTWCCQTWLNHVTRLYN